MKAVYFLVDAFLTFLIYAFLLRLLLQLVRADFRNPLSQAALALTDWLIVPLRRVLPPIGRVDTASVVALILVQAATLLILSRLGGWGPITLLQLPLITLQQLALKTILLYTVLIFIGALLSLLAPASYSPATQILDTLCDPVLRPIRALRPVIGGLDFSPFIAIVGLQALRLLIT